jgi:hypothetical protein
VSAELLEDLRRLLPDLHPTDNPNGAGAGRCYLDPLASVPVRMAAGCKVRLRKVLICGAGLDYGSAANMVNALALRVPDLLAAAGLRVVDQETGLMDVPGLDDPQPCLSITIGEDVT